MRQNRFNPETRMGRGGRRGQTRTFEGGGHFGVPKEFRTENREQMEADREEFRYGRGRGRGFDAARGDSEGGRRGPGPGRGFRHGERAFGGSDDFGEQGGHFGRRRGRMFDSGDVKLVILKLLSEEPAHGYQLMKRMEQKLAGGYTPSAGAIYPTLTMLEEEGLLETAVQENRKVYSVTAEGTKFLDENKERVQDIFTRLEQTGKTFARGRSPELVQAFDNLRGAVAARVARGNATKEMIRKMSEAINSAAKSIDEL